MQERRRSILHPFSHPEANDAGMRSLQGSRDVDFGDARCCGEGGGMGL